MTNVIAFTPRPRPPEPAPAPLPAIDLRTHLEDAAQTALDAAEKVMAALDHLEVGEGTAPPLAATIVGHAEVAGEGVLRFRYATVPACEEEAAPEPVVTAAPEPEPDAPTAALKEAEPELAPEPIRLPWRGAGNVVSAAGCAILALVGAA